MTRSRVKHRRRRRRSGTGEASPMESVANLVDIMLVFICGLIVAIVMFWNVDLDNLTQRTADSYESMGQVFQDPETGKVYVIKSDNSDNAASGAEDGSLSDSSADGEGTADGTAASVRSENGGE